MHTSSSVIRVGVDFLAFIWFANVYILRVLEFDILFTNKKAYVYVGDIFPLPYCEERVWFSRFSDDNPSFSSLLIDVCLVRFEASIGGDLVPDGAEVVVVGMVHVGTSITLEALLQLVKGHLPVDARSAVLAPYLPEVVGSSFHLPQSTEILEPCNERQVATEVPELDVIEVWAHLLGEIQCHYGILLGDRGKRTHPQT